MHALKQNPEFYQEYIENVKILRYNVCILCGIVIAMRCNRIRKILSAQKW